MNTIPQINPNLITAAMYSALASQDLNCANAFLSCYVEPADQSYQIQIAAANRFWRFQLGHIQSSTTAVRESLVDNCNPQDWVRLFAVEVAPVVVAFGLPRAIGPVSLSSVS